MAVVRLPVLPMKEVFIFDKKPFKFVKIINFCDRRKINAKVLLYC